MERILVFSVAFTLIAQSALGLTIDAGVFPSGLTVDAGSDDVAQNGPLVVTGVATIAGRNVTLNDTANDFDRLDIKASGFASLVDANALSGSVSATSGIDLTFLPSFRVSLDIETAGDFRLTQGTFAAIALDLPSGLNWRVGGDVTIVTEGDLQVFAEGQSGGIDLLRQRTDVLGSISVVNRFGEVTSFSPAPAPVPLPAALPLMLVGLASAAGLRRWR